MIWEFLVDHNIIKNKDNTHNAMIVKLHLHKVEYSSYCSIVCHFLRMDTSWYTKYQEPNTNQGILGNRHPYTWGINPYIKLHSKAGNSTASFPLTTFLYPFFSHTFCQDKKRIVLYLLLCFIALQLCTAVVTVAQTWNGRFPHGHHSNTPRAYLWNLIESLITTAASLLFGGSVVVLVGFGCLFSFAVFLRFFFLLKVRCLVILSCVFYRGNLLRGIFIYLGFVLFDCLLLIFPL